MSTKTQLILSSISSASPGGKRDDAIDFSGMLENSETIDTDGVDVTGSEDAVLLMTDAIRNPTAITADDGSTIAVGKGVQFRLATQTEVEYREVTFDMTITGNSGSQETYEILIPVVDRKRK